MKDQEAKTLEEIKAVFNVQISWNYKVAAGSSRDYLNTTDNTYLIRVNGKDFSEDGFRKALIAKD